MNYYECTNCEGRLETGWLACPRCGEKFDAPVPDHADPTESDEPNESDDPTEGVKATETTLPIRYDFAGNELPALPAPPPPTHAQAQAVAPPAQPWASSTAAGSETASASHPAVAYASPPAPRPASAYAPIATHSYSDQQSADQRNRLIMGFAGIAVFLVLVIAGIGIARTSHERAVQALVAQGQACYARGDHEGAISAYRQALQRGPDHGSPKTVGTVESLNYLIAYNYFDEGWQAAQSGYYDTGITDFKTGLTYTPNDSNAQASMQAIIDKKEHARQAAVWRAQAEQEQAQQNTANVAAAVEADINEAKNNLTAAAFAGADFSNPASDPSVGMMSDSINRMQRLLPYCNPIQAQELNTAITMEAQRLHELQHSNYRPLNMNGTN